MLADANAPSPIFLQLKEALDAVLAPHVGHLNSTIKDSASWSAKRLMQAASDIFLGWTSYREHEYYVRQYRDMKGSVNLDAMTLSGLASYAQVGGRTLARAHARSGDAAMISGYMARGTRFEDSVTPFAASYADQVAEDHRTLVEAAKSGRVTAAPGL